MPEQPIVAKTEEKDEYAKCDGSTVLEIKPGVATVTTDEATRYTTLVKKTIARESKLSLKKKVAAQDDNYPMHRPRDNNMKKKTIHFKVIY